ncbi:hypothetical protein Venkman_gp14 [Methylophilales phage Venkman EXVC282S]|nr:hypothetical protein Venkman_gp14 [Methylophilales phage Venkman EXVC282S]
MSNKISIKEFYDWIDENEDVLESIDNNIYDYDDELNAEGKLETSLGREIGKVELKKLLDDFLNKELDVKYGKVNDDMTLYNVFYTYGGVHEYEGTTNNIKTWLAMHNKDRLASGEGFEWEDEFSFEEIDFAIYKENEHE